MNERESEYPPVPHVLYTEVLVERETLRAEVERLRNALTNVAENLHGAGLISDIAKADILRTAGSATPTGHVIDEQTHICMRCGLTEEFIRDAAMSPVCSALAGPATPTGDDDE